MAARWAITPPCWWCPAARVVWRPSTRWCPPSRWTSTTDFSLFKLLWTRTRVSPFSVSPFLITILFAKNIEIFYNQGKNESNTMLTNLTHSKSLNIIFVDFERKLNESKTLEAYPNKIFKVDTVFLL